MDLLSSTALSKLRSCPRKYQHEYINRRVPIAGTRPLEMGIAWHKAMEHFWTEGRDAAIRWLIAECEEMDEVDVAKLVALLRHYKPPSEQYTVEAVETEFSTRISIPGRTAMRKLRLFGRIDLVVRDANGRKLVIEHKTTSDEIIGWGHYWQRLNLDAQTSLYMIGTGVDCVLYDVVKKPYHKPSKADEAVAKAHGCSVIDAYIERLSGVIAAAPEEFYQFREIRKTPDDLDAALADTRGWIAALRQYRSAGFYPRNTDACRGMFGFCPYLDVCSGSASLDDDTLYQDKGNGR